jgi:prepilin-type N-terminal cleavage/methylation domain-containing protein
MKPSIKKNDEGFSLVESIITIVIAAILGVMMFNYSNTSYIKSSSSLTQSAKTFELQKIMENIFTDYNKNYKSDLAGIQTMIGSVATPQPLTTGYGTYTLMYNDFIKFVGNIETPIATGDPQKMLKVTIKNDSGETLSILLTKQEGL